jgi:hypothetical protein
MKFTSIINVGGIILFVKQLLMIEKKSIFINLIVM